MTRPRRRRGHDAISWLDRADWRAGEGDVVLPEHAWAALMASSAADDTAPQAEFTMDTMDATG
jgi:hypothetical protein